MKAFMTWLLLALAASVAPMAAQASQMCDNVVVGMTPGGNGVAPAPIYQQQCYWKAGGIAFDIKTREFASTWNYDNADQARAWVAQSCGAQCISYSFFEDFAYIAIADDDSAWGLSTASADHAIAECARAGGNDCALVITASSTAQASYWMFGGVAYDAATGAKGNSWNYRRLRDAHAAALKSCGAPGCWAYAFQGGQGAIAKAPDGRLFGSWSRGGGLLFGGADREAKKSCKKASGSKDCEVVVEGAAVK